MTYLKRASRKIEDKILAETRKVNQQFDIPMDEDLKVYLTICDESISFGLFKNDKSFDQNRILICNSDKSKNWAGELFKNIKHDVIK